VKQGPHPQPPKTPVSSKPTPTPIELPAERRTPRKLNVASTPTQARHAGGGKPVTAGAVNSDAPRQTKTDSVVAKTDSQRKPNHGVGPTTNGLPSGHIAPSSPTRVRNADRHPPARPGSSNPVNGTTTPGQGQEKAHGVSLVHRRQHIANNAPTTPAPSSVAGGAGGGASSSRATKRPHSPTKADTPTTKRPPSPTKSAATTTTPARNGGVLGKRRSPNEQANGHHNENSQSANGHHVHGGPPPPRKPGNNPHVNGIVKELNGNGNGVDSEDTRSQATTTKSSPQKLTSGGRTGG